MFGVSSIFLINTFTQQGCIKLMKSDTKDIYNVQKISISYKCCSFELSTIILSSLTVFIIDNNQKCFLSSKSAYENDFWRSCDTEDWSNDAENSAAHHRNKLHFNVFK